MDGDPGSELRSGRPSRMAHCCNPPTGVGGSLQVLARKEDSIMAPAPLERVDTVR